MNKAFTFTISLFVALTCIGIAKLTYDHRYWGNGCCSEYTAFMGTNEKAIKYNKYAPGAAVDDGLFVAIPDGGPYNGYTYYQMKIPRYGGIDGGPARLPKNPATMPMNGIVPLAAIHRGHVHIPPRPDSFAVWHGGVPELPDGTIILIGSKFFFWVSGGGALHMGNQFAQKLERSRVVTIKSKAVPKKSLEPWYDESDEELLVLTLVE